VRGIFRRNPRLELVAGLAAALALPALTGAAAYAQSVNTTTTLTAQSSEASSCSLTSLSVAVTGNTGTPAGTVAIEDETASGTVQLSSTTLDSSGQASFSFALADGTHSLSAVYAGNTTYIGSTSASASVTVTSQCSSKFVVTVSNLTSSSTASASTLTLTPGQTGTGTITVTPVQAYVSTLTAPTFVNISCSGLPDEATCTFTPVTVEILPSEYAGITSSMEIQTVAASSTSLSTPKRTGGKGPAPIAWAFLPGVLGLGGLAWGTRRRRGNRRKVCVRGTARRWFSRISLLVLLGFVMVLGATGCNPRYNYEHHKPATNPATPAGTYTVKVTAQSSNGVTASTYSTNFVLTVE
jgi:hypothetical protein